MDVMYDIKAFLDFCEFVANAQITGMAAIKNEIEIALSASDL